MRTRVPGAEEFRPEAGMAMPLLRALAALLVCLLSVSASHAQVNAPTVAIETPGELLALIQRLRAEVAEADGNVLAYRTAHPQTADTTLTDQQIAMLLLQIATAEEKEAQRVARLEAINEAMDSGLQAEALIATGDASLIQLVQAKDDLLAERAELATTFRRAHPIMQAVQAKIVAADRTIAAEAVRIVGVLEAEGEQQAAFRATLQARLDALRPETAGTSDAETTLRQLELDAQTKRRDLEFYMSRYIPAIPAETVISLPADLPRPAADGGWMRTVAVPGAILVVAVVALLVQAAILRRRHYRRGFDAGRQSAFVDTGREREMLAEWSEDGATDAEPALTADRRTAA